MNHQITYLHCGEKLKESLKDEIDEVLSVVDLIQWEEKFKFIKPNSEEIEHLKVRTIRDLKLSLKN